MTKKIAIIVSENLLGFGDSSDAKLQQLAPQISKRNRSLHGLRKGQR